MAESKGTLLTALAQELLEYARPSQQGPCVPIKECCVYCKYVVILRAWDGKRQRETPVGCCRLTSFVATGSATTGRETTSANTYTIDGICKRATCRWFEADQQGPE